MSQSPHHQGGFGTYTPRHDSLSSARGDYSDPRHPRIDTIILGSQAAAYSQNPFDTASPTSTDYNLAYNSSPHGSVSSATEREHKIISLYPSRDIMAEMSPVTGMMISAHRTSTGSVGAQPFNRGNGSVAGSDTWSPGSARALVRANSDESLPKPHSGNHNSSKEGDGKSPVIEDEKAPAWSELKTKAGKERKRLPLACIACRRKKIRCSGEKPACKHCLRSRIPCVYKVTARKAAPRTDYMAMLDKRLKRMEERVIKIIPKDDLPDISVTGRSSVKPPIPGQTPKQTKQVSVKKRSADEAFMQELDEWTESKPRPDSLITAPGKLKSKEAENKLFTEGAESLPPLHIQEHLAEVFFDCVYGQSYLLLHKPSFMRKLKAGTVPPVLILAVCAISARFSTHPQVGGEPAFLRGEVWANAGRKIIEKRHYEPNITILTVMIIFGLHYFGTCEGGLSWSFGGQAMRMAYALQLHKELDRDPLGRKNDKSSKFSFIDREIRRRTMWACFLMDTFNSSGTDRPSFGNEDYMHIQLPIKESYFQMDVPGPTEDLGGNVPNPTSPGVGQTSNPKENMGVAAYVVRAVIQWKRIVTYLNLGGKDKDPHPIWHPDSKFAELQRQITRLSESLPSHLTFSQENLQIHAAERVANQFLLLHIILQQNMLFLNRFAIPVSPGARPPKDMPKSFLSDAGREVVEAANQISTLIEQSSSYMFTVPFAGYCAYAASTVHVWGIFSKNPQLEISSKENLRHNYKYLNRMKKYWGMFHYMAESVKDIYRHFADAAMKGHSQKNSIGNSNPLAKSNEPSRAGTPMFQYGDWFDKYPHGVSEADWEESHHQFKKEQGAGEAVMSQPSDLQSVEEFFASLSPPTKAEQAQMRARKAPKRRGKSSAGESKKTQQQANGRGSNYNSSAGLAAAAGLQDPQAQMSSSQPAQQELHSPMLSLNSVNNGQAFNADYMDTSTTSPHQQIYQPQSQFSPAAATNYDFGATTTTTAATTTHNNHQLFSYSSVLPQLDRQMVFGAYADVDPTVSANGGLNNALNMGGTGGLWEGMDMGGMGFDNATGFSAEGGFGSADLGGSAWFMPFNIDPPIFGGGGADVGGYTDMDAFSGSFSAPSGVGDGNPADEIGHNG